MPALGDPGVNAALFLSRRSWKGSARSSWESHEALGVRKAPEFLKDLICTMNSEIGKTEPSI